MEQKSFVFKKKWYDEIKEVKSKTLQLEIFDTLFNYAFNGIEPSYDVSFISRSLWLRAKPDIDAGVKTSQARSAAGKKGGNPNFKKGQPNPYLKKKK